MGLPPFAACGRGGVALIALVACVVLGSACSSSSRAAAKGNTGSTPLTIPPPFEVGQEVGLGAVTISVSSFRRSGDALSVHVAVGNSAVGSISIASTAFSIFYGSERHPVGHVTGLDRPIAGNGRETGTLDFAVPANYPFPLLWFDAAVPGARVGTIVLRGASSQSTG